jgi:hypothetical protein
MDIEQEIAFRPIIVKLQSPEEALAFAGIMDKVCGSMGLTDEEEGLAIAISNALTNKRFVY